MLLRVIVSGLPGLLLRPWDFPVFWVLVFLVFLQYRRVAESERRLYGVVKNNIVKQVAWSMGAGAIAGLLTSLVMAALGASLTGAGVTWLLPLALVLMAINPRFMCFSYAGGIIAVSNLLFGWPEVYVPAIMALVAVLHLAESVLIALRGASCTTPVTVRHSGTGAVRTGFLMQGFWPLPLLLLFVVALPPGSGTEGLVEMPNWWPLIVPPPGIAAQTNAVFTLFPVAAVLGYSDLAARSLPRPKARASAALLLGYSVVLLGLAVLASHLPALVVLPALWGPLGHELVVRLGSRREFADGPALTPVADGLTVLDVFPQSGAARAGIRTGDLIRSVDGRPAETTTFFGETPVTPAAVDSGEPAGATGAAVGHTVKVVLVREGRELSLDVAMTRLAPGEELMLGVIPVPAANTPPQLEVHSQGYFARLLARLTRSRK
jgi:hypothetical protein